MKEMFSDLESLGFKNLDNINVYEEEKNETSNKSAQSAKSEQAEEDRKSVV